MDKGSSRRFATFADCVEQMKADQSPLFQKYRCEYGVLDGNVVAGQELVLHYVFVDEGRRNAGLLKAFLQQMTSSTSGFKRVCILGVQSQILDDFLCRFLSEDGYRFRCIGGDFVLEKQH